MSEKLFEDDRKALLKERLRLQNEETEYQGRLLERRKKLLLRIWHPLYILRRWSIILVPAMLATSLPFIARYCFHWSGADLGFAIALCCILGLLLQIGFIVNAYDSDIGMGLEKISSKSLAETFIESLLHKEKREQKETSRLKQLTKDAEYRKAKIELLLEAEKDEDVLKELKIAGLLEKL